MNKATETLIEVLIPVMVVLIISTFFILLINQDNKEINQSLYTELQSYTTISDYKHIIKEAIIDNKITYKEYNNIIKYIDSTKTIQSKLLLSKD